MSSTSGPKFFKQAKAEPHDKGVGLLLDGKPVKTPKGRMLIVPSRALAEALADEWNALVAHIDPQKLPLTRLVNTAIDGTGENRALILTDLRRYAGGDLLCYRSEGPEALVAREAALWDPLLVWAGEAYGVRLAVTAGIMHRPQLEKDLDSLLAAAARLDDFALTVLHLATGLTGSLVIGLALAAGRLDPAEAWQAAQIDEAYQAELWGADPEAQARADRHAAELATAHRFLCLLASQDIGVHGIR